MTNTEYPGTIITLTGADLKLIAGAFAHRDAHTVAVWMDPIDGGVKFKFDNGPWSPPLGQAAP